MKLSNVDDIVYEEVAPGVKVAALYMRSTVLALSIYKPGSVLPEHRHIYEQVTYVLEGNLEVTVGGKTRIVGPGSIVGVESNAPHSSRALDQQVRCVIACSPILKPYIFGKDD